MTADFLAALHPSGFRDLRALHGARVPRDTASVPAADIAGALTFASHHSGRGDHVYVGVASRACRGGRCLADCQELHALFVEIDFKETPEPQARAVLAAFPFTPSAIVASGGGLHVYWLLTLPLDPRAPGTKALLRALAITLRADTAAAEPARILRVPGTINYKYDPPRPVTLEHFDATRRYDARHFLPLVGPLDLPPPRPAAPVPNVVLAERLRRARAWLAGQRPAISGEGGDAHTYAVCCSVAIGHNLGEDDALAVLAAWNARCLPPWSVTELRQKLHNAINYGDPTSRGAKLIARVRLLGLVGLRGLRGLRGIS